MKKIKCLFALLLIISGCQRSDMIIDEDNSIIVLDKINDNSYRMIAPIDMSKTREYHSKASVSSYDFDNIGTRLTDISKDYFSPNEFYLGEGNIITYDMLTNKLVKRESESNEMGLNPKRDEPFPIAKDSTTILNPVIVSDVIEQDYYKKIDGQYELAGMAVSIIMNPNQSISEGNTSKTYTISDDMLFDYGSTMARKVERYLRTTSAAKKIPILITLYVNGKTGSYIPGYMLGKAYFKDKSPSMLRLNEQWVLFPTSTSNRLDGENYSQFTNFKTALSEFIISDVGIVGYGFYTDNNLKKLKINVQYTAMTYVERLTLINYASKLLQTFNNNNFDIEVYIKTQSEMKAIIYKKAGSNDIQVMNLS